jgi:hypothetical protein
MRVILGPLNRCLFISVDPAGCYQDLELIGKFTPSTTSFISVLFCSLHCLCIQPSESKIQTQLVPVDYPKNLCFLNRPFCVFRITAVALLE